MTYLAQEVQQPTLGKSQKDLVPPSRCAMMTLRSLQRDREKVSGGRKIENPRVESDECGFDNRGLFLA